jgi:hypothetical protein
VLCPIEDGFEIKLFGEIAATVDLGMDNIEPIPRDRLFGTHVGVRQSRLRGSESTDS